MGSNPIRITMNMKCENCEATHSGAYASGRFCSNKCARGFSTKNGRAEISRKVSASLSGVPLIKDHPARNGWANSPAAREKAKETMRAKTLKAREERLSFAPFEKLQNKERKQRVLQEQNFLCNECGNTMVWNNKPLMFHLDHIDGEHQNNERSNLRCLCPNCHSQTQTYAGKNKKLKRIKKQCTSDFVSV